MSLPGRQISPTYYCRWHVGFNGCRAGFYPLSLSVVDGHYLFCWALPPVQNWLRLADWHHPPPKPHIGYYTINSLSSFSQFAAKVSHLSFYIIHTIIFCFFFCSCSLICFTLKTTLLQWISLGNHSTISLTVKIYSRSFMPSNLIDHVYQVFAKLDLREGGHVANQVWSKSRYAQSSSNSSSCQSIELQVSSPWQHQLLL